MRILPSEIMTLLTPFKQVFSRRIWDLVEVLIAGAILTPGKRTVTAVLSVMGLKDDKQFQNFHRVLNRAKWSSLQVSQILFGLLVDIFLDSDEPLFIAADETLERRWGPKIEDKSIFRDGKRSGKSYTHFTPALRWVSMMLCVSPAWTSRQWALPFLTVLAPGPKTNAKNGKRHKTSIDWIRQMITTVRRWLPDRGIVLVVDGGLAAGKLGLRCRQLVVTYITRLRLDVALFASPTRKGAKKGKRLPSLKQVLDDPQTEWTSTEVAWYGGQRQMVAFCSQIALWWSTGRDPLPIRWVLVRDPLGELAPTAFMSTDLTLAPEQILRYFIGRWGVEVTFQEVRAHLGFETQRQWSALAIVRTSPALLGLFSFVTMLAHHLTRGRPFPFRKSAWYHKEEATFSDALAIVRRYMWVNIKWCDSRPRTPLATLPVPVIHGLVDTLCYSS
jgi:hypothetical protein